MAKNELSKETPVMDAEIVSEEKGLTVGTSGKELVQEQHEGFTAIFNPGATSRFYTDMKADTLEGKAVIIDCMNDPSFKLTEIADKRVLMATHILAHGVQMVTDDGEILDADRIVLVLENGDTVAGVAKGFKAGITNLVNVVGEPPWENMPIFIRTVKTRKGFNTFNVGIATDEIIKRLGTVGAAGSAKREKF